MTQKNGTLAAIALSTTLLVVLATCAFAAGPATNTAAAANIAAITNTANTTPAVNVPTISTTIVGGDSGSNAPEVAPRDWLDNAIFNNIAAIALPLYGAPRKVSTKGGASAAL